MSEDEEASIRVLLAMFNDLSDLFAGLHDQIMFLKDRIAALENK